jgi:hypothetical protein
MSPRILYLILLMTLAALHLPVLTTLFKRRAGQESASMLFSINILVSLLLTAAEGLWRGGQLQLDTRAAMDFQLYGALALAFILTLTIVSFIRRDLRLWLGLGVFWALGFIVIVPNLFGFGEVVWSNGRITLTLDRLAPAWAILGWLVFMLGAIISVRSAHSHSRQPLYRNRLNYWSSVFLLVILNDVLLLIGLQIPGSPVRFGASVMAAFIIVTHDPPDLREVARRVLTSTSPVSPHRRPSSMLCQITIRFSSARGSRYCSRSFSHPCFPLCVAW